MKSIFSKGYTALTFSFLLMPVLILVGCGGGSDGGDGGPTIPVLAPVAFATAFTQDGGPVAVASAITVADVNSANLSSGTVTITNLTDAGNEILAATASGMIGAGDISYVAPTLTITPAGGAPLADFQAVLQSVTYDNTLGSPTETPDRLIEFVVKDEEGASNTATSTVTVTRAIVKANSSGFLVTGGTADPSPGILTPVRVFDAETGALAYTLNNPVSANGVVFDTGPRVAVGDFDGDGRKDEVAVIGSRTGGDNRPQVNLYDMSLIGFLNAHAAQERFFPLANPALTGNGFIAAADFDGDGDDDLAVAHFDGAVVTLQVLLNGGQSANYSFAPGLSAFVNEQGDPRVGAGDIDDDGNAEIVVVVASAQGASVNIFNPVLDAAGVITNLGALAEYNEQFSTPGYTGGASIGIGEFAPIDPGKELVLGADSQGRARVVSVVDPGTGAIDPTTPVMIDPLLPFGGGYTGAVRVGVGTSVDSSLVADVIVFGQDAGQVRTGQRDYLSNIANIVFQDSAPAFKFGKSIVAYGSGIEATGALANPLLAFQAPLHVDRGIDGQLNALQPNMPNIPANVDNATGTVPNNTTRQFVIPNNFFAQPAGTLFDRFFVDIRLRTSDDLNVNALNDLDVDLRVIQADGISIENFELYDAGTLDDGLLRFTGQFGKVTVTQLQIDGQSFGFFVPEGTRYTTVFTDLFADATNEIRLDAQNQNAEVGDVVVEHFEVFFLYADTTAIIAVDTVADTFTVAGDQTALFPAAGMITVSGSTGNDGSYTVMSSIFFGGNTIITINEDITDLTADGSILTP